MLAGVLGKSTRASIPDPSASLPKFRDLYAALKEVVYRDPRAPALVCCDSEGSWHRLSYGEMLTRARRVAAGLAAKGVRPGDRVGLLMTNLPQWPIAFFACMRLGAVVVPISTFLKAAEVRYILRHSKANYLVMLDRVRDRDLVSLLAEVCPDLESDGRSIRTPILPDLRTIVVFRRDASAARAVPRSSLGDLETLDAVEALGADPDAEAQALAVEATVSSNNVAVIKYTSGSTGFPKGVILRHGPIVETECAVRERLRITPEDVYCTTAPMFHMSGSAWGLLAVMMGGGVLAFPELPEPPTTVEMMEREKCTIRFGFPASYLKEVEVPGANQRHYYLRALCGRPPTLVEERLRPLYKFELAFSPYGITEAYGPVTVQSPGSPPEIQSGHTCGSPLTGQEVQIRDPATGEPLPVGQTGEICIRGRIMDGYWADEDATRRAIDDDGWLHTEDLGWIGDDGHLRFVGRARTRLKVGGENVSVEEIERLIADCPGVQDVVVVPIDDEIYGQRPYAFVQCDRGTELPGITSYCRANAAWFKVPKHVAIVQGFPLLGNGKPDRVALTQCAEDRVHENDRSEDVQAK